MTELFRMKKESTQTRSSVKTALDTMEDKATQEVGGCHHVILIDGSSLDGRVPPTLKALHLVQAHDGEMVEENSIMSCQSNRPLCRWNR